VDIVGIVQRGNYLHPTGKDLPVGLLERKLPLDIRHSVKRRIEIDVTARKRFPVSGRFEPRR
jgi:hypothetical protein